MDKLNKASCNIWKSNTIEVFLEQTLGNNEIDLKNSCVRHAVLKADSNCLQFPGPVEKKIRGTNKLDVILLTQFS